MPPSEHLPPSLRQLRNQAKDLHKAQKAGDPSALRRIGAFHPRFSGSSQAEIAAAEIVLADAQLVIARELGFRSWPKLKTHIESLAAPALSAQAVVNKEEARAAAEIEKLGGRCEVDSKGQVRTVSLNGQKYTDAVTEHLRGLTSLERLYLFKTQVSDDGLEHLKGLANLERLYLSGTRLTDAGLECLTGLIGLRRLDLRFTQVTKVGADELNKALPNCRIYR